MIENLLLVSFLGVERLVAEGCFTAAYPLHVVRVVWPSPFYVRYALFSYCKRIESSTLNSDMGFIRSGKIRKKLF